MMPESRLKVNVDFLHGITIKEAAPWTCPWRFAGPALAFRWTALSTSKYHTTNIYLFFLK